MAAEKLMWKVKAAKQVGSHRKQRPAGCRKQDTHVKRAQPQTCSGSRPLSSVAEVTTHTEVTTHILSFFCSSFSAPENGEEGLVSLLIFSELQYMKA